MNQFSTGLAGLWVLACSAGATAAGLSDTLGEAGRFSLGLNYEGIYDQDLDADGGHNRWSELGAAGSVGFPELDDRVVGAQTSSNRGFLEGIVGVHAQIDLLVKLGVASMDTDYHVVEPGISDDRYKYDGDADFAWGLGLRARLFEAENGLRIMGRVEYLNAESDADPRINGISAAQHVAAGLTADGAVNAVASDSGKIELEEYRIALVAAKSFDRITPYGGLEYRYTDLTAKADVRGTESGDIPFSRSWRHKFDAKDNLGVLLGVDGRVHDNLALNAEVGFVYGTTLRAGAEWRF